MHKLLFYNKFIICLYMFRAQCAHQQEVKIVLYSIWYRHTVVGRSVHIGEPDGHLQILCYKLVNY